MDKTFKNYCTVLGGFTLILFVCAIEGRTCGEEEQCIKGNRCPYFNVRKASLANHEKGSGAVDC